MYKVIKLQLILAGLAGLLCAALWGRGAALSAVLGGMACVIPTAWFAWRLSLVSRRKEPTHVTSFVFGEAVKVLSIVGILVAVRLLYPEAHWGAVVMGLFITLQANFLAFLVKP